MLKDAIVILFKVALELIDSLPESVERFYFIQESIYI